MTESMQNLLNDWPSLATLLLLVTAVAAGMAFHAKRTREWEALVLKAIAVVYKKRYPEISETDHMNHLWSITKKKSIRNKISRFSNTKENRNLIEEIFKLRNDKKVLSEQNKQWKAIDASKAEAEKLEQLCKRLGIDWKKARGKYTLTP